MKTKILAAIAIVTILALTALTFSSHRSHAQASQQSDKLARFAALMQYIRSEPTPADVNANPLLFDSLDATLSDIYITGFITPFTGETSEQVEARLQSIPEEDRFTAVMVESYRLAESATLLDLIHDLLSRYYVEAFTTSDLSGAVAFMQQAAIATLTDSFDSANYAISTPTATGTAGMTSQAQGSADSDKLARFAALMQYIRSEPTPADVSANPLLFDSLDATLSEIYITGFITPFTGETSEQVEARLQSIPEEDRFTAVMVESYRLAESATLLDLIHDLLSRYYVEAFTTSDLSGAVAFMQQAAIATLADGFDPTDYAISAPSTAEPPDTGSPETDRAALVALYNATDGDNWQWNFNWLSDEPLEDWHGVTTDDDGRAVELDLGGNQLTGMIPSELGDLSRLEWLSLTRNQLSGPIPPELGKLSKLEFLSLSSNQLTGDIPSELGDLSELTQVYLWGNDLSGAIPSELGDLSNLKELILYNNGLTGAIPPELGKLTNLEDLLLAGNDLSGAIPSELGSLANLEFLSLAGNDLTGCIPNVLGDTWSNDLSELGLSFCAPRASDPADKAVLQAFYSATDGPNWSTTTNWLSDQPMGLWYGVATDSDGRVIGLSLPNNQLSGNIPTNLGNLSSLKYLDLGANQLGSSIPTSLGNLTNLTRLYLYGNQLDGSIPTSLGNLTNLTWLHLDGNRLSGAVPPQLGNLANLTRLYLRNNELSGALPQSLTRITGLRVFRFTGNSGELCAPDDAAFQAWLQAIPFRSGPDCAVFADRDVLIALYNATDGPNWSTSTNWLSNEPLGEWHGVGTDDSGRVDWLGLENNGLSGEIPTQLGNLINLEVLGLQGNRLTGPIPSELGRLTKLEWLSLSHNQLTDPLPQSLTAITGLEEFYFGHNDGLCAPTDAAFTAWLQAISEWSGPDCEQVEAIASDRAALVALYNATDGPNWSTSTNWLTDKPLEDWHGVGTDDLGRVDSLDLGSNNLSGNIPSDLGNLSKLELLELGGNQLSGEIPSDLGNLSNLEWLWLGSNQLSGEIPSELGNLSNLQGIGLVGNDDLTGCVPDALGDVPDNDFDELGLPFCEELAALTALYNATDGDNWTDNTNWLSDEPLNEWFGIEADNGRVFDIDLTDNSLTGTIPPELGNIIALTGLSLSHNALSGQIPSELGDLDLHRLYLSGSGNSLSGCIPNTLGDTLNNDFYALGLSFCSPRASDPSDKAILEAFYNATGGSNWPNSHNWLSDKPLSLWYGVSTNDQGRVIGLSFYIGNNLNGSIPVALSNLADLRQLILVNNDELNGVIPPQLGNLANLEDLRLRSNSLSGSIPDSFGNLASLESLMLNDNELSGPIPPQLGNLADSLFWLWLRGNQLTGCVPDALRDVPINDFDELGLPFCAP